MTLALIITSGVLVYGFIGLIVYHVWVTKMRSRCSRCERERRNETYYGCSLEHEVPAFFQALCWPVLPLLTAVGYALFIVAKTVSNAIESKVKEKI